MKFVIETDDESDHRRYLAGPRALVALVDFSEAIRSKIKYDEERGPSGGWEEVRDLFLEYCGEVLDEER
jgi:hypothetical protein